LVARSPFGSPPDGLWDRLGNHWFLVDIDGTRADRTTAGPSPDKRASCPAPPF
jgi:hypothetical protein